MVWRRTCRTWYAINQEVYGKRETAKEVKRCQKGHCRRNLLLCISKVIRYPSNFDWLSGTNSLNRTAYGPIIHIRQKYQEGTSILMAAGPSMCSTWWSTSGVRRIFHQGTETRRGPYGIHGVYLLFQEKIQGKWVAPEFVRARPAPC